MAASATAQEMYATDGGMGTLGIERLPGGLHCDTSLCYGHLAVSVARRLDIVVFSPPEMRIHCQFRTMGSQDRASSPSKPPQL